MNNHLSIAIGQLSPHPRNPRIEPRQEIVGQLAARMADGFDPAHALIVRPTKVNTIGGVAYEIISGHHRWLAAQKAGLTEVPCWVKELTDDAAYMELVLCNTQSELHPLEEGKHAAESGMDLKAYAERAGKARPTLQFKVQAYRVSHETRLTYEQSSGQWRNLAEIHAAPKWLWPALAAKMLEKQWTVAITRERVSAFKDTPEPMKCLNAETIATYLVDGVMSPAEIGQMQTAINQARVREEEPDQFLFAMRKELIQVKPARLSAVQSIIAKWEDVQAKADAAKRQAEMVLQKAAEDAAQRVANLRRNCSLEEWKALDEQERQMLLVPQRGEGGTFNGQKNESIEWAQWSWNPVTGCKHDCPYCYARDIALSERMQKASLYPNGFEPTFRSHALNCPANTKVPAKAADDTRFRNVFTCSMADLFGRWVPDEWIDAVLSTVRDSPEWNFLFLTKFPQRFKELEIPDNAWMGTTVDMQARVKNAEKAFEGVGGKVKWLSVEPLIERLKFERLDLFDWLVIGGASRSEQTPEWRPPYRWIEDLVRQADDAGVPVYMKTNLGIANRVIELPFDAPITRDPQQAPDVFRYLGK